MQGSPATQKIPSTPSTLIWFSPSAQVIALAKEVAAAVRMIASRNDLNILRGGELGGVVVGLELSLVCCGMKPTGTAETHCEFLIVATVVVEYGTLATCDGVSWMLLPKHSNLTLNEGKLFDALV
ncbi:hypothetical protein JG688_00017665 [Phytophthora aleatoria]|uniref:Uncharacterized protein n=1 Tax=Phytophthora aleatoria TaxID=2496075 RepID=A0A8J5IQG4_9STRA|nr:hypothetical protein JG688_00017665 [Phytophthora aleatoria]